MVEGLAPTFSIGLAAQMTGIPEETLRVWERRYAFPRPERTQGGARLYTSDDIARLRSVRRALDRGFRPGAILGRTGAELDALLAESDAEPRTREGERAEPSVGRILDALESEDSVGLVRLLRTAALLLGGRRFVVEIAHPASVEVGARWAAGRLEVRHEHLLSAALTAQLNVITATFEPRANAAAVLLTTLPGARHALGLDMIAAYIASRGASPRVLGVETPPDQIVAAAVAHRARVVGIGLTPPIDRRATAARLRSIARQLERATSGRAALWVGGEGAREIRPGESLVRILDWSSLDAALGPLL